MNGVCAATDVDTRRNAMQASVVFMGAIMKLGFFSRQADSGYHPNAASAAKTLRRTHSLMKEFQICGLGNAIVDIFLEVSDTEFGSLGFQKGGMALVDHGEQKTLLERYQKHEPRLVSGGSVANSIIAFSQLG